MTVSQQLSERQRACLELVAQGMSSKEIASEIGLSPRSVDTYLTAAVAKLKASNRREAARIFLSQQVSQKLPSQSEPIVEAPEIWNADCRGGVAWILKALFPIPIGGSVNELKAAEKFLYSARIGLAGVVTLLAIATTFMGLMAVL